ncbi:pyruvate dehydrogenase complex dihydrolipoamide acetyltransferase [Bordetella genomosp. 4]|uniref:Acetyltransferase component of pyruvate dehydrogenase complex n=1 Tax=Bordetella genomosp. 4 TaxID=463044 RepID=A0A261TYE4_9BORD|nr:pyruvate dehydrogenase complex dihydrolipoamide acetyltransferase [Bordetella genomosp. 4]OZI54704.1 pyruvate dehydrogenase complex dihydrolipoamide acetyltransferase [Bordetella genomosp. 4]
MASVVRMPEIAANAESATLLSWEVDSGASVRAGDTLALIETDKATVDLVAEHDGTLSHILAPAGRDVAVGAAVAVLLANGESEAQAQALLASFSAESASLAADAALAETPSHGADASCRAGGQDLPGPETASAADSTQQMASVQTTESSQHRQFASPLARRLAAERGIDLRSVRGSGPNGRVVKRDLPQAASQPSTQAEHDTTVGTSVRSGPSEQLAAILNAVVRVPHSKMRKTIARRLSESKATVPHFYLDAECRAGALLTMRDQINGSIEGKISINDLIIKAAACALRDLPEMNVTWTEEDMLRYRDVDISVAVSTDKGLYTPVLRRVEKMSLTEISQSVRTLAQRARDDELLPHEYQGGAFSISNLGMYGVSRFSAIINPPQSAILAVGAVQRAPVVVNDQLGIEPVLKCTLSVDHRAIDGALAAQWLSRYTRYIEQPWAMLV